VVEFEIDSKQEGLIELGDEIIEIQPKPRAKKLKGKKIKPTLILEEAEEAIENPKEVVLQDIVFPGEQFEIIPVKKRKTRKQREQKLQVNPLGKKGTRRKLPENINIIGDIGIID